jgi:MFS family permease
VVLTPRTVVAAVFIAASALVLMGVQPILVGLYADQLHLTLSQNGWVIAAEQVGACTGAVVGYWLSTRVLWKASIAGACAVAVLANILTALAVDVPNLLIVRFTSGLATTLAYTVAVYCLGHARTPDRAFGVVFVLQTVFMSIDAIMLPTVVRHFGYVVGVSSGSAWFAAAIVAARWLPKETAPVVARAPQENAPDRNYAVGVGALIGSFLLELSVFAVWGFMERVGRRNGISDELVGYAIAIGVLGGIPGGLLPAVVGARFGRLKMVGAATVLLIVSYAALVHDLGWLSYSVWVTVLNLGWVLGIVYYMGLAVHNDPDGRFTRLLPFAQTLGTAVGPACSALATGKDQLWPIFLIASFAAATGMATVLGAQATTAPWRRRSRVAPT